MLEHERDFMGQNNTRIEEELPKKNFSQDESNEIRLIYQHAPKYIKEDIRKPDNELYIIANSLRGLPNLGNTCYM